MSAANPDLTVIMVSYNTCELTLRALGTLLENSCDVALEVILWDNASADQSAQEIARRFPEVKCIAHPENIGFARANNEAAKLARGEYLLLLNPDTETYPEAIGRLLHFARLHQEAGIVGGRTVYPDGSLNPTSCWNRMSLWSLFCAATGLARLMPKTCAFNPEAIGCWSRDSERNVDIVTGCFLLLPASLWNHLGGFDERYFMYGEDADLCLRAQALGYRPRITPDATIMHLVGASTSQHERKITAVLKARATLVRRHWRRGAQPIGLTLLWLWAALRLIAAGSLSFWPRFRPRLGIFLHVWAMRRDWLGGY